MPRKFRTVTWTKLKRDPKLKAKYQAAKESARDPETGEINVKLMPRRFRTCRKKEAKINAKDKKKDRVRSFDEKIYVSKWYPYSYRDAVPMLVLQGFYSIKYARLKFQYVHGLGALKDIKFIKGKTAIERGFEINANKTLFINGKWRLVTAKWVKPPEAQLTGKRSYRRIIKRAMVGKTAQQQEKELMDIVKRLIYARQQSVKAPSYEAGPKLQKIQEANRKRKEAFLEE